MACAFPNGLELELVPRVELDAPIPYYLTLRGWCFDELDLLDGDRDGDLAPIAAERGGAP